MSVKFAQQTELAEINKRACQRCTSMQTQVDEDKVEDRVVEERMPRASHASGAWLEEVEKERLERELEERDAEIRKLKEKLQKTELATEQVGVVLLPELACILCKLPLRFHHPLYKSHSYHPREFITAVIKFQMYFVAMQALHPFPEHLF